MIILHTCHGEASQQCRLLNDIDGTGYNQFRCGVMFLFMRCNMLQESMDKTADMQQETKDLQVCVRSLQEKMEVINQVNFSVTSSLYTAGEMSCSEIFFRKLHVSPVMSLEMSELLCDLLIDCITQSPLPWPFLALHQNGLR